MKIRKYIQLLVPPIYYKVKKRLFPKKQPKHYPLPKIEHEKNRMIVIGNGPSLNKTIELYLDELQKGDTLMVNHSASSDIYELIKPSVYTLVDPLWFRPELSMCPDAIRHTIDVMVEKTSWPMKLVLPSSAKGSKTADKFQENPNIEVMYFEDGWNKNSKMTQNELWDNNLVSPPGQTVLNTALWIAIYWGYKETYLVGADSSILDLRMDQKDNKLYTIDTHYYNNDNIYGDLIDEEKKRPVGEDRTMEIEMYNIYLAHKDYWDLRRYADWKGVKVYNASEYSWVDAFERKKLK